MWRNAIVSKHNSTNFDRETKKPKPPNNCGIWKGIYSLLNSFNLCAKLKVGNGSTIRFWEDSWVGDQAFCSRYPSLYAITSAKNWTVMKCATTISNGGAWNLGLDRRLSQNHITEVSSLLSVIEEITLDTSEDSISWSIDKSGKFTVKLAYSWFNKDHELETKNLSVWSRTWPHKIGFFLWQVYHKKITTMDTLRKKGTLVVNGCLLCRKTGESATHLLFHCPTSSDIWRHFLSYINIEWVMPNCMDLIIKGWRRKILSAAG